MADMLSENESLISPYVVHNFEEDSQSGAGNCKCGHVKEHRKHPHEFRKSADLSLCVCGLSHGALQHQITKL